MKVYKYRGIDRKLLDRDLKTFINNQFFAPNFEMLNDPFEANFNETISITLNAINKVFDFNTKDLISQLNKVVEYKSKLGIYSLSRNCFSEQMWAYYASSNKGYCVEYDIEKLIDRSQNPDFVKQLDILYTNQKPSSNISDLTSDFMFSKMYGTKKDNWKHEEEIRLLFDNCSIKSHHATAITAIYFGYLATDCLKTVFFEKFENRDIKFYQIVLAKESNKLERKLIKEFSRKLNFDLSKFNYELLKYKDNSIVENYYLRYYGDTTPELLKEFVFAFREKYCIKQSNIYIFNNSDITELIGKYPLRGDEYIKYANSLVALADSSSEDVLFEYPFKDFYYRELTNNKLA